MFSYILYVITFINFFNDVNNLCNLALPTKETINGQLFYWHVQSALQTEGRLVLLDRRSTFSGSQPALSDSRTFLVDMLRVVISRCQSLSKMVDRVSERVYRISKRAAQMLK